MLTSQRVAQIRRSLLAWYEVHEQPFPWRTARDPYAALVAAVAAQQTQIARVLEIYERWMRAFPTLEHLARTDRAVVLRVWGRAGYPRRAVALHETAARCMAEHHGALPRDPAALLALPGVGPFTAAIVRTFGWGDDAPAVDTNVVRVIGRVVFGDLQPARATPRAAIDAAAARLLPPGEARWNPALMDFGGRVCLPRPRCEGCVLASICADAPPLRGGRGGGAGARAGRFDGSDRQARGRLLAALREASERGQRRGGGRTTRVDATPSPRRLRRGERPASVTERARLRRLLAALVAEGLAWRAGGCCGLGVRAAPTAVTAPSTA